MVHGRLLADTNDIVYAANTMGGSDLICLRAIFCGDSMRQGGRLVEQLEDVS